MVWFAFILGDDNRIPIGEFASPPPVVHMFAGWGFIAALYLAVAIVYYKKIK